MSILNSAFSQVKNEHVCNKLILSFFTSAICQKSTTKEINNVNTNGYINKVPWKLNKSVKSKEYLQCSLT